MNHDPPAPSTVAKHHKFPKRFDEICAKAFAKSPADRYQDMREMISDIKEVRTAALRLSGEQ